MSWFVFALICVIGWGFADLFYKKGTDDDDKSSHLKIAVWVGLVMGVVSVGLLLFGGTDFSVKEFFIDALKYSPASLCYIISMVIGYAGLRYLEVSIVSPVQNASGGFSMLCMIAYGLIRYGAEKFDFTWLQILAVVFVVGGTVALAFVENGLHKKDVENRKYRLGAKALIFPLLYCLFDTIGTAFDGLILDSDNEFSLNLEEIEVLILYGLTFLLIAIVSWFVIWIKDKKPYNPFTKKEITTKGAAALCEEFGQIFYVYALADESLFAAPMVASYCIVSVILSRIFLKEKLTVKQYACVIMVIIGIVILGFTGD